MYQIVFSFLLVLLDQMPSSTMHGDGLSTEPGDVFPADSDGQADRSIDEMAGGRNKREPIDIEPEVQQPPQEHSENSAREKEFERYRRGLAPRPAR